MDCGSRVVHILLFPSPGKIEACAQGSTCNKSLASFPGPTQLFVACSTEKRGEPGIFSHVSMM